MNKLKTVSLCSSCMNVPTPRYTRSTSRADSLDQQMVLKGHESAGVTKRDNPERHAELCDLPDVRFLQESRQEQIDEGSAWGARLFSRATFRWKNGVLAVKSSKMKFVRAPPVVPGLSAGRFSRKKRLQLPILDTTVSPNGTPGPTNQGLSSPDKHR